jgi:anti-sigma regulatory factor (Ser/Thr protein kinase)
MEQKLKIEIRNNLQEIARIGEILEDFGQKYNVSTKVVHTLYLAIDELVTNTISYGYPDKTLHIITLDLTLTKTDFTIVIRDDGEEFDPNNAPEPDLNSSVENRRVGGLGIHLVKNLLNKFEYKRINKMNVVTLMKNL